jgi:hypothetical protein
MNPSAPHEVTRIGTLANELYKRTVVPPFEERSFIITQIDPISFQVLLRSMTMT